MSTVLQAEIDAQLNTRARAPHYDQVNAAYAMLSASARARLLAADGVAYGPHPLERMDLLRAAPQPRGIMVWYHGGLWRARDRADFHFLADGFARLGLATIAVGYPKVPEVPLRRIVDAAINAFDGSAALLADRDLSGLPVFVGGHSAGAHLAAMTALARPEKVAGLLALSGLYDLEPVRHSFANADLRLDATEAEAMSPLRQVAGSRALPGAVFLSGSEETEEFHRQATAMAQAWQSDETACHWVAPSADHYTILFALHGGAPLCLLSMLNNVLRPE